MTSACLGASVASGIVTGLTMVVTAFLTCAAFAALCIAFGFWVNRN